MADDDMFGCLSSDEEKGNDNQDMQNEFDDNNQQYQEEGIYGNAYAEDQGNYFMSQPIAEDPLQQQPSFLYQQSSVIMYQNQSSYVEPMEPVNQPEVKNENQMEEEQMVNVEIKQANEIFELNNDHLNEQEDESEKEQPIRSQADMKPIDEPQYNFLNQEFQDIFEQAKSVQQLTCFPPPYFRNFISPKQMAPPSLEVIQKNKSYFSLGQKIDFESVYQKPSELVSVDDRNLISNILTPEKNIYDVMQEVMSSIMNKSLEIFKHSSQGGQHLSEYITEMDTLVKQFSVLTKISKIKFAKLEVKNIFEKEKVLFEKSTDQINQSLSQIKRFKDTLQINEILNSKNPVV